MRHFAFLALLAAGIPGLAKADTQVQGVNPADLLTQFQFTGEYNRISSDVDQWLMVAKYDYKFANNPVGLNFELPIQGVIDTPFGSSRGHGDLFARIRYIRPMGRFQVGAAFEVVAPIGEKPLTGGRWQTNPGLLVVYPWNNRNITAYVHKRIYGYITDDASLPDINQYSNRILQIHIWPNGWFAQGDVSFLNDSRNGDDWIDARASVGKQLSASSRMQVELKKFFSDRDNDFALSVSYAIKM